jgi:hypothetical protein
MKKIFIKLLAFLMVIPIFIGGAGMYIISYCCNDCEEAGIAALINDKCCDIHHHPHKTDQHYHEVDENTVCDFCTIHTSGDCCSIERVSFDWNLHNAADDAIKLFPVSLDLFSNFIYNLTSVIHTTAEKNNLNHLNGPPIVLPHDYLSVLTVLLI